MKLDRRLTKWERERRVEELLIELGLKKCEHTRIEKLSGGESKRLAFATEVSHDLMFFCSYKNLCISKLGNFRLSTSFCR